MAISDQLLQCDSPITFDGFDILSSNSKKFKIIIKKSLLIKCDKPVWNKTIKSTPLGLFDLVLVFNFYRKNTICFQNLTWKEKYLWIVNMMAEITDKLFYSKSKLW